MPDVATNIHDFLVHDSPLTPHLQLCGGVGWRVSSVLCAPTINVLGTGRVWSLCLATARGTNVTGDLGIPRIIQQADSKIIKSLSQATQLVCLMVS